MVLVCHMLPFRSGQEQQRRKTFSWSSDDTIEHGVKMSKHGGNGPRLKQIGIVIRRDGKLPVLLYDI